MKLINRISIRYFRSLHTIDLKKCSDLNIITGRNDAGKSNVIKALNLFFNEQTDWESEYDFYDNFSKKRLEEVRQESVKGKQFISIKIEFERPRNYKGSLPPVFTVERRWNRDSKTFVQTDNLATLEKSKKLPTSLTTAQRSLAKLLNRTHFEYVPAIKDRGYVDNLLSRLQQSLLDMTIDKDQNLLDTANNLAKHIEGQITDLKTDFEKATTLETFIKPPDKISSLFHSFLVSTETTDGDVPLMFRGDGLQSRYIASVLHYIAVNSNDFHIWGYEEPEIALEYTHASKMADDFCGQYSSPSQIFLTTHSPAFVSLEEDNTSCYRALQENSASNIVNVALKRDFDHKETIKDELGVLEIQKEVHDLYSERLKQFNELNERVGSLEDEVNRLHKPLVVTEGKTDRKILEIALEKLGQYPELIVRECDNTGGVGGTGGAGTLGKLIESIHPDDDRVVIAIFDNDDEGQKEFGKLSKNFTIIDDDPRCKGHSNGYAWALLLPEPEYREGFVEAKNLCIEYLFKDSVIGEKFSSGAKLELKSPPAEVLISGRRVGELPEQARELLVEYSKRFRKIGSGKDKFASEIVPNLDKDDFEGFVQLIDDINWILE